MGVFDKIAKDIFAYNLFGVLNKNKNSGGKNLQKTLSMKKYNLKVDGYEIYYTLILGSYEEFTKYYKKTYGEEWTIYCSGAVCRNLENKITFFVDTDRKDIQGTIAHEACHLSWIVNDILKLDYKGFRYSTQELQAYMIGSIVKQINKKIK